MQDNELLLTAADTLSFVYGLFEVSRRFLGVQPFWFWNDQKFIKTGSVTVPQNFTYESKPARVRYRGWFVNDETLISHWKVERRSEMPQCAAANTENGLTFTPTSVKLISSSPHRYAATS